MAMTNTLHNLNAYLYNSNAPELAIKEEDVTSPPNVSHMTGGTCSGSMSYITSNHVLNSFNDAFGVQQDSPSSPQEDMMRLTPPSSPDLSPVNNTPGSTKRRKRAASAVSSFPTAKQNSGTSKRNRNCTAKCSNCAVEQTPLWRKGADGKTLCNKCGLYWSRHSKHRPVRLDRSQMQEGAAADAPSCPTHSRKPSLPGVNTKMAHSSMPALKAKKLESPLKRSFSFEEQPDDHQSKRKKLEFSANTTRRKNKKHNSPPAIHEEVSNHAQEGGPFEDSEESCTQFTITPNSTPSVAALQQQLAAFVMQQQAQAGHSSENEVRVVQEQSGPFGVPQFSVVPPVEDQQEVAFSSATGTNGVPSDPFLAQLLTATNGDTSYFHQYLQTQIMDSGAAQQYQQQLLHQSQAQQLTLQIQQRQYEQQQLQLAFNDNSNMHSPCGDNLDSLFSSLFGSNAPNNCGNNSLDSCTGSLDSYADCSDSSAIDGGFLGSPFL